jgi:hypothetical protein
LEHKPQNLLKEAIEEATLAADKLGDKLLEDIEKISGVLQQKQSNWMAQVFLHKTGGVGPSNLAAETQDQLNQVGAGTYKVKGPNANADSFLASAGDKDAQQRLVVTEALTKALQGLQISTELANRIAENQKGMKYANASAASVDVKGYTELVSGLKDMLHTVADTQDIAGLTGKKGGVEAAQEAAKAAQKAYGEMVAEIVKDNEFMQAQSKRVTEEITASWMVGQKEIEEGQKREAEADKKDAEAFLKLQDEKIAGARELGRQAERDASVRASADEEAATADRATGAITAHGYALATASAHADEFRTKIAALIQELDTLNANTVNDKAGVSYDPKAAARQQELGSQIGDLDTQAKVQAARDSVAEFQTTWSGMVDSLFDEVIKKGQDTEEQIKAISIETIDSLNDEVAKVMTGQKYDFRKVWEGLADKLAKSSLETAESWGMKALGLGGGGKQGTRENPMWTKSADAIIGGGGFGGAGASGLLGMLNDSNWASSLFGGSLFGAGSFFGGGHALGGDVMAGVPIDVGELGRERFVPQVPGRIVPNSELGGQGGMSIGSIDARGTDPVQTHMAIVRAMDEARKQGAQAGAMIAEERSRRRPR